MHHHAAGESLQPVDDTKCRLCRILGRNECQLQFSFSQGQLAPIAQPRRAVKGCRGQAHQHSHEILCKELCLRHHRRYRRQTVRQRDALPLQHSNRHCNSRRAAVAGLPLLILHLELRLKQPSAQHNQRPGLSCLCKRNRWVGLQRGVLHL